MRNVSWNPEGFTSLPYADLFFSPYLEEVRILVAGSYENSRDVLQIIATALTSTLPVSTLQRIHIHIAHPAPQAYLTDSFSSFVLRCGPSLTEFMAPMPMSDAAITHLIQLPNLRNWRIGCPPPTYSTSSLPLVFPPLTELSLESDAPRGWLSLFKRLDRGFSTTQSTTPLSRVKESLKSLMVICAAGAIIDASFTSAIQIFCNLVSINVLDNCYDMNRSRCTSKLNNDDVTEFAAALPRLEVLRLGSPCPENTCLTTVACLLAFSVHCVKLRELEIHFNTTNIVKDFRNSSVDPRFRELRSLPKCPLSCLYINQTPLSLDAAGFEVVANGMVNIFPSLRCCRGDDGFLPWERLTDMIARVQETRTLLIRRR